MSDLAGPSEAERQLRAAVAAHDRWRSRSVFNLLASENAVSPRARSYLASDLAGRYTLPIEGESHGERIPNSYTGTRYTDQIERIGNEAAARLFQARRATVRPLSGHIAALSVLVPLLPRGSRLLAVEPGQGGYDGYAPGFIPGVFGYTVRPLPASGPGYSVVAEEAVATIRQERPTAVLLGQSFFLFPYPLREIAEAAHAVDALVLYDASHVLGLVAGGEFQDPLREGADIVYGSTHKSFPGPQGGLIVTNREDLFAQLDPALVWRVFDNAHWNRIAGVAQTLLELERWAPEYARTVVEDAQSLARELSAGGLPLVAEEQGFTRSHQVHMQPGPMKEKAGVGPGAFARRLERQRLLIDYVGRIGTAEAARLGLTPTDMPRLANLILRAGLGRERVGPEVLKWRRSFRELKFA